MDFAKLWLTGVAVAIVLMTSSGWTGAPTPVSTSQASTAIATEQ